MKNDPTYIRGEEKKSGKIHENAPQNPPPVPGYVYEKGARKNECNGEVLYVVAKIVSLVFAFLLGVLFAFFGSIFGRVHFAERLGCFFAGGAIVDFVPLMMVGSFVQFQKPTAATVNGIDEFLRNGRLFFFGCCQISFLYVFFHLKVIYISRVMVGPTSATAQYIDFCRFSVNVIFIGG